MRSIMDLISDRVKSSDDPESQSSTLTPIEEELPATIKRLNASIEFMLRGILDSESTSPKVKFMMKKILDEAMEELREAPEEIVADGFLRNAAMFYWVSSGEVIQNMPMPVGFWDYVGTIPELSAPESLKELEAGASVE
jgi:hypothetical protein